MRKTFPQQREEEKCSLRVKRKTLTVFFAGKGVLRPESPFFPLRGGERITPETRRIFRKKVF